MPGDIIGHVLVAVGALIAAASQMHMARHGGSVPPKAKPGAIVETGPFALSRNPVFVGQIILFVGLLLVFPDLLQATLTLALIIANRLQIKIEERVLAATLGEPYLTYSSRVGRWFGLKNV